MRRYRSPGVLLLALGISLTAQGAAVVGYVVTRPPPKPTLTIHLGDAASSWDYELTEQPAAAAAVRVDGPKGFRVTLTTPAGEMVGAMSQPIEISERTLDVRLTVTAPDGAQWSKKIRVKPRSETTVSLDYTPSLGQVLVTRAGEQSPMVRCDQPRCGIDLAPGTSIKLTAVLGEGATFGGYRQLPMRTPPALHAILGDPLAACVVGDAVKAASDGSVFECALTVTTDTDVAAEFGHQPKEVDVALDTPPIEQLVKPLAPRPPPVPIEAEKLEDRPLQVALKPPPKPEQKPLTVPPPPPPKQQPEPKKPPPPPPNMVMVEVKDDKHVVDKAPDDAKQLSDKNRDVAEETRAKQTNLDKDSEGREVASRESDDHTSPDVGGPDDRIRQLEETQATTDQHIRETDHSGKAEVAKGGIKGDGGQNGEDGTGERGVLAMRGIGGRGSIVDNGKDGKKVGKRGTPGINTPLTFKDYERMMGKDKVDEERQVAARKMTSKKGRWERKLDAIKSSLENFIPDVRVGNQTALKTRAHPFALYVARMHRRIHELWGFGFLENLDGKGADYPLNDPNLWVNLELSVNPDGTVHKVTIAKTSGKTEFDVAAVDTVISAGPYEPTPEAIRSVDGRIYLRWGFYRNWRQCGTFNVEPYILTEVPDDGGQGVLDDGAMVKNIGKVPGKRKPDRPPIGTKTVTPDDGVAQQKVSPDSSVTDKQALFAANLWVSAFATAQVDKLAGYSTTPFYAGGKVVAQSVAELREMFGGLVVESGRMKDWKLLTPAEAGVQGAPEGTFVLQVRTEKEAFSVILSRTPSGDYRATQLAR
ncbi:MAG TPA: TonB family protein [Kofleriaceae bacterium]|nr:TonB family protein [Kofleriaceae bacterium]